MLGCIIEVSNITKYFKNSTQLEFLLISINGNLLDNQNIIISINWCKYIQIKMFQLIF